MLRISALIQATPIHGAIEEKSVMVPIGAGVSWFAEEAKRLVQLCEAAMKAAGGTEAAIAAVNALPEYKGP